MKHIENKGDSSLATYTVKGDQSVVALLRPEKSSELEKLGAFFYFGHEHYSVIS